MLSGCSEDALRLALTMLWGCSEDALTMLWDALRMR